MDRGYDNYATLENFLFGAVKSIKNADIDKYKYSGHGTGFVRQGTFSVANGFGRNVLISGVDMSYSMHVDNKKKDILILGEDPAQGLDDTILSAEKRYSINFAENNKKLCLSLHYNGANSYLFVNGTEIRKLTAKDSSVDNLKKTGLNGYVCDFSVDYDAFAVFDTFDVNKHLMKQNNIK